MGWGLSFELPFYLRRPVCCHSKRECSEAERVIWKPALAATSGHGGEKAGFHLALRKGYAWLE
jgi:hypothetical protein